MAITCGFFDSLDGDRVYNADQMSQYFRGLISDGVYESIGGALQVTAGAGMSVNVQTGRCIINSKWMEADDITTIDITAAHPSLDRYTAVVARLDVASRLIGLYAVDGTPAAKPTRPALTRDANTAWEICLAYVLVKAGTTSISQTYITDTRANSNVCGWITGLIEQVDTSTLFLQWQAAYQDFYNAFTSWFDTLTSQLQVNTYLTSYDKHVSGMASAVSVVPLDMDGYTYDASDVLMVYINGLAAVEGVNYTINTRADPAQVQMVFTNTASEENEIYIRAIKSKIGDPVSGGGSSFEALKITEKAQSTSTFTVRETE